MLSVIWGFTLFMCFRQADLCERRSVKSPDKCSVEWQLAITAGMGMGQSVLGLFTTPPTTQPRRRGRGAPAAEPYDEEP
jgi:hypothetical protein